MFKRFHIYAALVAIGVAWVAGGKLLKKETAEQKTPRNSLAQSPESRPSLTTPQDSPVALPSEPTSKKGEFGLAGATPIAPETARQLESIMSRPVEINHGGGLHELALAKDEIYVRNADGIGRVVPIPPAANAGELLDHLQKVQSDTGSAPELILYPIGAARNDSTRRVVTRDILIEADSRTAADSLAAASGLSFKSAPVYAQGKYIYQAPSSPEALAFFVKTAESQSPYVTPLLASLTAKRAMPNDPLIHKQWHLKFQNQLGALSGTDMNVEPVWKYPSTSVFSSSNATTGYIRGNGVAIGIVDDGLQWSHPDLSPNVIKSLQWDWNGKDNDPSPDWGDDHGTACAGVAAARGNNKIGVSGVAPEASLVGMRLIAGAKTDADEAEAMTWKLGQIHILSNSWGPYDDGVTLGRPGTLAEEALKYAADFGRGGKGTIITWAGGNGLEDDDNSNYDGYANSIYTIAVAAMDSTGAQSYYSERGSNLVITAPSNGSYPALGILTTDNKGRFGYNPGLKPGDLQGFPDNTETFGGTSSATPAVSGVIALMLQRNPNLGWRDVQEILMRSAVKVDSADAGWISANRTDHVTGNATVPFHFNEKYGAGLVDAAAAVALSGNWTNLKPQKSQTVTSNATTSIGASATITRTFSVNSSITRAEHVTLQLTVTDIPKGNLTVTLASPGNTTSTFCLPHSDTTNKFENWKFMTVRSWAENPNGDWTLTITNNGTAVGNLTTAELVVYGTELGDATNPPPMVTLAASSTKAFVGSNITLTATAIDQDSNGSNGSVKTLEAFVNDGTTSTSLGTSNGTWTLQAQKAGNFTFTVNATDSQNAAATSKAITVQVLPAPIAAWDFDTTAQSPVPLGTAVQSVRRYAANFGSGNLTFNGGYDGAVVGSNKWEYHLGQIFTESGTAENAIGGMEDGANNTALLLRGGKNLGAEGKSIVLEFSMAGKSNLNVSYATGRTSVGFATQKWFLSTDGSNWVDIAPTVSPTPGDYDSATLPVITALNDSPTAYLKVVFSGATAASGVNVLDNVILSATEVEPSEVPDSFSVLSKSVDGASSVNSASGSSEDSDSPASPNQSPASGPESNLEWVAPSPQGNPMLVHAEVVDGARFLNSPGSLLSASSEQTILGIAEPMVQSQRYELAIAAPDSQAGSLRLRLYDSQSKKVKVLSEKVGFEPGATLGSPSTPKRFEVDHEEVEQIITVSTGWNDFTTAIEPEPSRLGAVLTNYDAAEGDRVVGPTSEAVYRQGAWTPEDFELQARTSYSLFRQNAGTMDITLLGKALKESSSSDHDSNSASSNPPGLAATSSNASNANSAPASSQAVSSPSGGGASVSSKTSSKKTKSFKKKTGKKSKKQSG